MQARGRAAAAVARELAALEQQLERDGGLPADGEAARAAVAAKRGELERLRRQLREHLDGLS